MLTALMLSEAWSGKGEPARAIAGLESATQLRSAATFQTSTGALWIHTRARLAELYRHTGQAIEAQRIEQHLRKLLIVADDDHPLMTRLAELSATGSQGRGFDSAVHTLKQGAH